MFPDSPQIDISLYGLWAGETKSTGSELNELHYLVYLV